MSWTTYGNPHIHNWGVATIVMKIDKKSDTQGWNGIQNSFFSGKIN